MRVAYFEVCNHNGKGKFYHQPLHTMNAYKHATYMVSVYNRCDPTTIFVLQQRSHYHHVVIKNTAQRYM